MRLPDVTLDDRGFQDLVNEARLRIAKACPEWTEHNVSDPGITLIELFSWLTEMVIYRLNRVPEKLHVKLMELLGIKLEAPTASTTEITFRLSAPATEPLPIPAAVTEVGTLRTASDESIVFQTTDDFTIPPARPVSYLVERSRVVKDVGVAQGVAKPKGPDQLPFGSPPQLGDSLYIGFDVSLARMLLQIEVDCAQARGPGVDPEDPPLRWEVSLGDGRWGEAKVLMDRTGGFNYGSGSVELELPREHRAVMVGGQRAYWVRCRVDEVTRSGAAAAIFTHPPEIYSVTGAPIGAIIPAAHSVRLDEETIGESDGTPGQTFLLRNAPVIELYGTDFVDKDANWPEERLEALDPDTGSWEQWELKESFVESGPGDKHFRLDLASGEVELGPAIRTADGGWRQYGAVPPKGATLRFTSYRHGGGRRGNVAAGTLTVLKSAIPGVASVVNQRPAVGGVDPETLDSARQRASMEIRTRYRAVTADDFEFLCSEASPRVARALALEPPGAAGTVRVHIVPVTEPADRQLEYSELIPDEPLLAEVGQFLENRRVIGTRVELLPANFRGVSVVVNLQASLRADPRRVEEEVSHALYTYLNPLTGGSLDGIGNGWEFGRALNQGELYGIVHAVEGVDFVKILRVYETNLATGEQQPKPAGSFLPLAGDELVASARHLVKAEHPDL